MKTFSIKLSVLTLGIFLQSQPAAAMDIEISAGAEQDSNLNVVELDTHTQESDLAGLFGLKIDAQGKYSEKLSLSGGYSYNSKTYQSHENFNLAIHQLSADIHYDLDVLTLGSSHHYADANLDGNSFLALNQTSFYASKLLNNRAYLRAAANLQNKNFNEIKERDADNLGFSGDVFIFFNNGKTFISAGLTNEQEDAHENQFDYDANQYNAKVSHKFTLANTEQKLQLSYRYYDRNYSNVSEEINAHRNDSGQTFGVNWELNFTSTIALETNIEGGEYNSNFVAANYSETRASVKLKARF